MFSLLFLITLLMSLTATAIPASFNNFNLNTLTHSNLINTATCAHKLFDLPWLLTGITVYNPFPISAANPGWIRFNFIDYNDRLQLETVCYGYLTNTGPGNSTDGASEHIAQAGPGGYIMCADEAVAFKLLEGGNMMVARSYKDRCLGAFPYNYGTAFGQNITSMPPQAPLPSTAGALTVQDTMFINITAMS